MHDRMKRQKSRRCSSWPLLMLCSLIACYAILWAQLSLSPSPMLLSSNMLERQDAPANNPGRFTANRNILPYVIPGSKKGKTLIVAFCNYGFRSVGLTWYRRMSWLGYDNHLLVATDQAMANFLASGGISVIDDDIRYHVWKHEPMPQKVSTMSNRKKDHAYLELLMAVRWKYLLEHLEEYGVHIVLTDADNIFTRYINVDQEITEKDTTVDVWHAYATKFPQKAFAHQGFVVCSGMSWWRSSPASIRFARLMRDTCGDMCDDQRELNNLLSGSLRLNMTWHWTEQARQSRSTNKSTSDLRFLGLPSIGISGFSDVTGHSARIWDRDFALRGPLYPDQCPLNNWVSMPILDAKGRQSAWKTKIESFSQWDKHCKSEGTLNAK